MSEAPNGGRDTAGSPVGPDPGRAWYPAARPLGARRPVARLRGWGGVAAMAVACVLTAALTLLPLSRAQDRAATEDGAAAAGPGVTHTQRTASESCSHPEASLPPSGTDGPTIDAIKKKGYLVAGIDMASYRWGYRDPNKIGNSDPEGFDIDLVHEIAGRLLGNRNAVLYRAVPTSQRVDAVKRGDVDMVVRTMTINCERAKDVAFSTAYFETGQQILAPKNSDITGYNETLRGKRVCAADGSTALSELRRKSFGADISTTVPNQLDCLVRLQLGEADAIVTDSALAAGQAAQDPTIEIKGAPFTEEYYGVAMKKGADDLVRRVNRILIDYRRSGWQESYDKWLLDDLGPTSGPPKPRYVT